MARGARSQSLVAACAMDATLTCAVAHRWRDRRPRRTERALLSPCPKVRAIRKRGRLLGWDKIGDRLDGFKSPKRPSHPLPKYRAVRRVLAWFQRIALRLSLPRSWACHGPPVGSSRLSCDAHSVDNNSKQQEQERARVPRSVERGRKLGSVHFSNTEAFAACSDLVEDTNGSPSALTWHFGRGLYQPLPLGILRHQCGASCLGPKPVLFAKTRFNFRIVNCSVCGFNLCAFYM